MSCCRGCRWIGYWFLLSRVSNFPRLVRDVAGNGTQFYEAPKTATASWRWIITSQENLSWWYEGSINDRKQTVLTYQKFPLLSISNNKSLFGHPILISRSSAKAIDRVKKCSLPYIFLAVTCIEDPADWIRIGDDVRRPICQPQWFNRQIISGAHTPNRVACSQWRDFPLFTTPVSVRRNSIRWIFMPVDCHVHARAPLKIASR